MNAEKLNIHEATFLIGQCNCTQSTKVSILCYVWYAHKIQIYEDFPKCKAKANFEVNTQN